MDVLLVRKLGLLETTYLVTRKAETKTHHWNPNLLPFYIALAYVNAF